MPAQIQDKDSSVGWGKAIQIFEKETKRSIGENLGLESQIKKTSCSSPDE